MTTQPDYRYIPDITLHRGLMVKIASKLRRSVPLMDRVDLDDIIQAVTVRSIVALRSYDPARGTVSTYLMHLVTRNMAKDVSKLAGYNIFGKHSLADAKRTQPLRVHGQNGRVTPDGVCKQPGPLAAAIANEERESIREHAARLSVLTPLLVLNMRTADRSLAALSIGERRKYTTAREGTEIRHARASAVAGTPGQETALSLSTLLGVSFGRVIGAIDRLGIKPHARRGQVRTFNMRQAKRIVREIQRQDARKVPAK
jgi:hypothetical protein